MCTRDLCSFDDTPNTLLHVDSFSQVDLRHSYHQFRIPLVALFGFPATHITFMRLMHNKVLRVVISDIVLVYFDDIFLYLHHVRPVLNDLGDACFFANITNLDNCIFCAFRVHFLGYALTVQDMTDARTMLSRWTC